MARVTTVTADDLRNPAWLMRWSRGYQLVHHFGRLTAKDVGRRVVERDGVLQIENAEQFRARTVAEELRKTEEGR